jgi:IMP dehydrogenase
MSQSILEEGLTFDDISLVPAYSEVVPRAVDVQTRLTTRISLNIPIISAAMDTVTEAQTSISLAREGGMGIIHRNMSIKSQAQEVDKVKKSESGMIVDPLTIDPEGPLHEVLALMERYRISGVPVVKEKQLVGIVTNRDLRFETDLSKKVAEVMTKDNLVTVFEGITLEESKKLLHEHRIEKLLVVDDKGCLKGLITIKDIEKVRKYPNSCKDHLGRLRVGAAVGIGSDMQERTEALLRAGADVIVIDTSHGYSLGVLRAVEQLKGAFEGIELIAGNVATPEGVEALIRAGADGVKIGIGPGSICTTRIIAGVGVPQATAVGAHVVMIGSLFAGTEESPGETILFQGRSYKVYRGMGSLEAMKKGAKDRYYQEDLAGETKLVPEGIVGRVPYKGSLSGCVFQLVGGLRAGMGYVGCRSIEELRQDARFVRITASGLRESHVHDVIITKEAPNYRLE